MRRWIGRAFLLPILLISLYCLLALLGALIPSAGTNGLLGQPHPDRPHEVSLVAGPIHYDFLIPIDAQLRQRFAFLGDAGLPVADPNSQWLLIGWGARDFYTTIGNYQDVEIGAILRGATGDHSVLRVDVLGALPPLPELPKVRFSDTEYGAFLSAIAGSFARDATQRVQKLPQAGFTPGDAFFAAKGQFHLFRTCNTWVARMILASGRRFGAWTPLPYSVRLSHALYLDE